MFYYTTYRVWLRPGQEVTLKVTLLDAIGRELLDERGPRASWELEPHHPAIEFRTLDRLFVETHPEYAPVPVPYKYYQVIIFFSFLVRNSLKFSSHEMKLFKMEFIS